MRYIIYVAVMKYRCKKIEDNLMHRVTKML